MANRKLTKADRDIAKALKHVEFLRGTLIPDLKSTGMTFTAQDFETCCKHIDKLIALVKGNR